jgi:transposase-like protein
MWSRSFQSCVKCGTTDKPHVAKGLCSVCYSRHNERMHSSHKREKGTGSKTLTKEYLLKKYLEGSLSLSDIARECKCSRQYVFERLKHFGITTRTKREARTIALDHHKISWELVERNGQLREVTLKKTRLNEQFFRQWSPEMAWVLGVIYTDGCLFPMSHNSNVNKIAIAQKEPELLEKTKLLMDCDARLTFRKRRQYGKIVAGELYQLAIANNDMYADLTQIGLTPRKSLTLAFPNVPNQYVHHFLRGCWDGDGSVGFSETKHYFRAEYVSGSKGFIDGMVDQFVQNGFNKPNVYVNRRSKNPAYVIRFTGAELTKLVEYLYKDAHAWMYLARKHELFIKGTTWRSAKGCGGSKPTQSVDSRLRHAQVTDEEIAQTAIRIREGLAFRKK